MQKSLSTGNLEGKLERKRNIFLSLLRKYPGISRQECAKRMQISTFNVTKLTPELIKEGMVLEDPPLREDSSSPGRPSLPLRLNPDYEYFAGIDFEASRWRFVIIDFAGNLLYSQVESFSSCRTRSEYIEFLNEILHKNISKTSELWKKVSALGIGSPGEIDVQTGTVVNYGILSGFKNIPVLEIYKNTSKKKTFIINNILCLAVHDLWKKPDYSHKTVLHLALRSGISGALSIDGNIYRGNNSKAGEAGLMFTQQNKFLQDVSGLAVLKNKLPQLPDEFWSGSPEIIDREYKKQKVRETINNALSAFASTISGIAAFLDPGEIIIYSSIFSEDNILWEKLKNEFENYRKQQQFIPIPFKNSGKTELNAAVGAALFAMESIYNT